MRLSIFRANLIASAFCAVALPAAAQNAVADFYRGKTLTLLTDDDHYKKFSGAFVASARVASAEAPARRGTGSDSPVRML